ncbi:MAG TPA: Mur ligase family protein [Acidimicrobiales bacterium]|nr:Mur ligase family protein [Acidimicrobiales bacterium]
MNALDLVAFLLGVMGSLLGGIRWLRVAQREHYLPGCCSTFAGRWWRSGPTNTALFIAGVASVVIGVFHAPTAAIAGAVGVIGPIGLGVRGRTSALAWTTRLRRTGVVFSIFITADVVVGWALGGVATAAEVGGVVTLGSPVLVDLALAVLRPLEDRLAMTFVRQAQGVLARVNPIVVGITGSFGKTSTKGYVAHLLASRYTVVASPKSFNNRAGLARTINEDLVTGTDVVVAEMGTYGRGEIAAMCAWMPPRIAVITAIGPVHLERFGTLERTLEAKSEIVTPAEIAVLNVDDVRLRELGRALAAEGKTVIACSAVDSEVDVAIVERAGDLWWYRRGERVAKLDSTAPGLGTARTNVAAAIGVAGALGCTDEEIDRRLGDLPIAANRLEQSTGESGVTILDDTFNSNPAGARMALDVLALQRQPRKVLVTPGMIELGHLQDDENEAFAALAATIVDDIVVVGRTNRRALIAGARRSRPDVALRVASTRDEAVSWVRAELGRDDAVLYENDLPDHYA